jgi:pyruvate dehydrogenase E2 component (dihydrolipoamide acetyltransferase)
VPAYHDIVAKLAAVALRRHPLLNCQWLDGDFVEPDGIHIGIAVDTEAGLLVPVIRDCDCLSLTELARRSGDLVARARARRCSPGDLSGGTFSITNLGAFGIDAFTPIINSPQAAVLGIGAIRREPVVLEDDRIEPRDQLTLSLTFDHQVADGAPAASFLRDLVTSLENPAAALIS